jgi:hypothetical protein
MTNTDETRPQMSGDEMGAGGDETKPGGAGDVEQAGETTAAATIGGDTAADKPVGADTLVEVEGDPRPQDESN